MRRNSCWLKDIEEHKGVVDDLFWIWHCVHGLITPAISREHARKFGIDDDYLVLFYVAVYQPFHLAMCDHGSLQACLETRRS